MTTRIGFFVGVGLLSGTVVSVFQGLPAIPVALGVGLLGGAIGYFTE